MIIFSIFGRTLNPASMNKLTYNIQRKRHTSQGLIYLQIKLVLYWFLFVYLDMVKEIIKSSLFLIVLLSDSASFSAVKLKNKKQKSLDTYSHLVLYLYNE